MVRFAFHRDQWFQCGGYGAIGGKPSKEATSGSRQMEAVIRVSRAACHLSNKFYRACGRVDVRSEEEGGGKIRRG